MPGGPQEGENTVASEYQMLEAVGGTAFGAHLWASRKHLVDCCMKQKVKLGSDPVGHF